LSEWIDITRPMDDTLVTWQGRARPQRRWEKRIADGAHCNVSIWELSAHSGTHMDAPLHFLEGGKSIDQIPPDVFMGECRVVKIASALDEDTARRCIGTKRLLLKSSHSRLDPDGRYESHGALMTGQAASLLLEGGLVLIGTDRLSVDDSKGGGFALHRRILGAGCVIIEGLLLASVAEGAYWLSATPLCFTGAEASPLRALLRKR
jgi:arylformamidase